MRRRKVLRGVASTGALALGAGMVAGETVAEPSGEEPYLLVRGDDGRVDIYPLEDVDQEVTVECDGYDCSADHCLDCECDCCKCIRWE